MGLRRWAVLAVASAILLAGCGTTGTDTAAAPDTTQQATAAPDAAPPAASEPFTLDLETGATGWDISYPQCDSRLPEPRDFAIIGVNGEMPTDKNPCFSDQLDWARQSGSPPLLYVNAANPAGYNTPTWPQFCASRIGNDCSYQYGQDRIAYDLQEIIKDPLQPGTVIFIAVEPEMFSWDDMDQTPASNTATLEGMADAIRAAGGQPGIYANHADWQRTTGGAKPGDKLYGLLIWWRGATNLDEAGANCQRTGFTGGPVVIAQIPAGWTDSGLDENIACGTQ